MLYEVLRRWCSQFSHYSPVRRRRDFGGVVAWMLTFVESRGRIMIMMWIFFDFQKMSRRAKKREIHIPKNEKK